LGHGVQYDVYTTKILAIFDQFIIRVSALRNEYSVLNKFVRILAEFVCYTSTLTYLL